MFNLIQLNCLPKAEGTHKFCWEPCSLPLSQSASLEVTGPPSKEEEGMGSLQILGTTGKPSDTLSPRDANKKILLGQVTPDITRFLVTCSPKFLSLAGRAEVPKEMI